ncbi:hypothetical protein CLAIMM_05511 isoform 2 [Cladophialophora immunda]|nr:hypothetical protein CLAIMM_05511 isoform 1 [Cladophialophora immunda]OQU99945.1 hypothetical protein CLAIMM_05511 isoform 2 [Cladophialophora immunda]
MSQSISLGARSLATCPAVQLVPRTLSNGPVATLIRPSSSAAVVQPTGAVDGIDQEAGSREIQSTSHRYSPLSNTSLIALGCVNQYGSLLRGDNYVPVAYKR